MRFYSFRHIPGRGINRLKEMRWKLTLVRNLNRLHITCKSKFDMFNVFTYDAEELLRSTNSPKRACNRTIE